MSDVVESKPSPAARVLMTSVRVYQKVLSPAMGGNCRYYPSCSQYGYDAIRVGGYDPVPEPGQHRNDNTTNAGSDA